MSRPSTVNEYLERAARHPEAGLRFVDRQERATMLTWEAVHARARRAAGRLLALGIGPGDRVALVFPTGPDFFEAFFGALLAGGVPVPLYPPVRLGRLGEYHRRTGRMLASVRARIVLADRRVRRILGETVRAGAPPLGCCTLADLPPAAERSVEVEPDDVALVQFSSGTTVDPKPVALGHRAIVAQAEILNGLWPDRPGLRHSGVSWLPLYHDMGLLGCVMPALERPGVLTLLPPEAFVARPALWLRTLSRYRATISPAPNFGYGLCASRIRDEELEGVDLGSWRVALNGAEAVVPAVARAFAERFARWGFREEAMTPVYGLSEAALAVTSSRIDRPLVSRRFDRAALALGRAVEAAGGVEIASLGEPLPGFDLRVVDPGGHTLPELHVGRVHVRGPSLMKGYLDQPELTAQAMRDGWLDTGDLGFLADGSLFLSGRAKDMLLLRGRNHAPEEVERAVDRVAGARTGCAIAASWLPEGAEGEALVLLVEAARGLGRGAWEALARECGRAVLSETGLDPDRVVIVEAGTLPRTSSGKLRRGEALRLWLEGGLHPPKPVNRLRLAAAVVRSSLAYSRGR